MAAHNGQLILRDGEIVERIPAAAVRAVAMRAFRRYESDTARGLDVEETAEAEAGAFLDAEQACDLHDLRMNVIAWLEAQR